MYYTSRGLYSAVIFQDFWKFPFQSYLVRPRQSTAGYSHPPALSIPLGVQLGKLVAFVFGNVICSAHLLLGLPRFRFPCGAHFAHFIVHLLSFILLTCPVHFHFMFSV